MNDILTGIIMTGSGKHIFKGLYDDYGNPVKVVLEKSDNDVILAVLYDDECDGTDDDCGISDEEIDRVCKAHDNCESCPLNDLCGDEWEEEI